MPLNESTRDKLLPSLTAVPHRTTPTPIPSPQGGGEEFAAAANRNCCANRN
jgi:hypothetical protein